ncbi:hypothetical protein FXO37_01814 [Capsicum annuum]|nr:hypothetical protein FXO37_01814 [Capsicum annuum]
MVGNGATRYVYHCPRNDRGETSSSNPLKPRILGTPSKGSPEQKPDQLWQQPMDDHPNGSCSPDLPGESIFRDFISHSKPGHSNSPRNLGKKKNYGNTKNNQPRNESSSGNYDGSYNEGSHSRQSNRIKIHKISQQDVDNSNFKELDQVLSVHKISKHSDKRELCGLTKLLEDYHQYQHIAVTSGPPGQRKRNDNDLLPTPKQDDDEPNNMEC